MSRRLVLLVLASAMLLMPMAAAAAMAAQGTVPAAADSMAAAMDKQILAHFGVEQPGFFSKTEPRYHPLKIRKALSISCTVAVDLNNLERSCPVGRQISEEIARWFVQAGYRVQEIRKGKDVYIDPGRGETLLTRDKRKLLSTDVTTEAVLAGTYVVTPEQVRFSMRLVHVPTNDILAMGTATVPVTDDLKPLLYDMKEAKVVPSIGTRLK